MLALIRNKTAQGISGWVGLLSTVFALLGKLSPQWFGALTWPQAILAGIALALGTMLLFSVALALGAHGFRLLRPLTPSDSTPPDTHDPAYDDTALTSRVAELEKAKRAIIDDYQRMSGLEARFQDEVDGLKEAIQKEFDAARMNASVIERKDNEAVDLTAKVEQVRVDGALNRTDLGKIEHTLKDERERRLGSFHALGARELLSRLQFVIAQDAADLYDRLKAGEVYDEPKWQQWENVHSHWKATLDEWLDAATWYALAVKERTLAVNDEKYGLGWSVADTQFPTAEAVRRFRKFRIVQTQWEAVVPSVKSGLESVAFGGLTDLEARSGRPAG